MDVEVDLAMRRESDELSQLLEVQRRLQVLDARLPGEVGVALGEPDLRPADEHDVARHEDVGAEAHAAKRRRCLHVLGDLQHVMSFCFLSFTLHTLFSRLSKDKE